MFRYREMDWNEIWMRDPVLQVEEEIDYYRERFEMIAEDLSNFDPSDPLLLEGAAYLPELLKEYSADSERVVFLVPTREFQIHYYSQRPWIKGILEECEDPDIAFTNWMERDQLFGKEILRQALELGYQSIIVDGGEGLDEIYDRVKGFLSLI